MARVFLIRSSTVLSILMVLAVAITGIQSVLFPAKSSAATTVLLLKDVPLTTQAGEPENLTNVNGMLFFSETYEDGTVELWKSDATLAGTMLIKTVEVTSMIRVGSLLFFGGRTPAAPDIRRLWKSDGTVNGTQHMTNISHGQWHTIYVRSLDTAGNWSTTTSFRFFRA